MKKADDMPRADGLRHDDPPFREFFSAKRDKPIEVSEAQMRRYENVRSQEQERIDRMMAPEPRARMEPVEDVAVMRDTQDIIAIIRKTAHGGKYVHVDKLIEALS